MAARPRAVPCPCWPARPAAWSLVLCLAVGCDALPWLQERSPPPTPAGVVLILIDTLRADHVGAYGSPLGLTPVLDDIAARGVVFDQAVAPSSWTRSTVASLFTSRYPSSIGVLGREDAIAPSLVTLAEILRSEGRFETLGVTTNANAGPAFGFAQGFDRFEVPALTRSYPGDYAIHVAEGVTRTALRLLDERAEDRPFLLFLHYVDPHDPYLPHPELIEAPEPPGRFDGSRRELAALDRAAPAEVTEMDRARIRHLYAGEVRYCDLWVGELIRGLEERGLRDRVLLIVTADHGEGLWDHGLRAHGRDLYEEQVRVPLIVDPPVGQWGDQPLRMTTPVSLLDIAPTILAAYGIPPPMDYRGADLTPLLRGERRPPRLRSVYAELDLDGRDLDALRLGDHKLIRDRRPAAAGRLELYDLGEDPGERSDLASQGSALLAPLAGALEGIAREVLAEAETVERVTVSEPDDETTAALRALGYLDAGARRGEPAGILAPILDFGSADHPEDQLVSGFYEHERNRRWMAKKAAAVVGRNHGEDRWRLDGWIDLGLHDRGSLTVTVRVNGTEPQRRTIDRSGSVALEGPLPGGDGTIVRLDFECDHALVPPAGRGEDLRSLCLVVQSIGVY